MRVPQIMCVWVLVGISATAEDSESSGTRGAVLKHLSEMNEDEIAAHVRGLRPTPPFATSTFHLARLAADERRVVEMLEKMEHSLLAATDVIHRYLTSWKELLSAGAERKDFVSHPLHAYAFTKHVSLGWPHIEDVVQTIRNLSDDTAWLMSRRTERGVLTLADLGTVSAGLARLHDYYALNLTALAHAHLVSRPHAHPVEAGVSASVMDLYRIGSEALSHNVLNSGVDFLQAAVDGWDADASVASSIDAFDSPPSLGRLKETLGKAVLMHDQVLDRKGPRSDLHSTYAKPFNKTLGRKRKYRRKEEILLGEKGTQRQGLTQSRRLCQGEDLRPKSETSKLYCRYVTNGSPLYVIGPLRMEVVSLDPFVVTIEDVVTPSEASNLVNASAGYLTRSSTVRANGGNAEDTKRTSSTAWMLDKDHDTLPVLTRRIEELVGVNAKPYEGGELYQVVNYGVGGHYTVHHDAYVVWRVATFLVYLTDVGQGGLTVFPWVGAGVRPKRGAALLWYNLDRAGDPDIRLQHAACPVLLGDKWVINKWLYYVGQHRHLPCSPHEPGAKISRPLK